MGAVASSGSVWWWVAWGQVCLLVAHLAWTMATIDHEQIKEESWQQAMIMSKERKELGGVIFLGIYIGAVLKKMMGDLGVVASALCRKLAQAALCVVRLFAFYNHTDLSAYISQNNFSFEKATVLKEKRIVFIRHGQSIWNTVCNEGISPATPLKVIFMAMGEMALSATPDSVIVDSPLSTLGISQGCSLNSLVSPRSTPITQDAPVLKDVEINTQIDAVQLASLMGPDGVKLIVCSSLRRAMSTAAIVCRDRLDGGKEKILVHPSLNENTVNPDGISLWSSTGGSPVSWLERSTVALEMPDLYKNAFEVVNRPTCGWYNKIMTKLGLAGTNQNDRFIPRFFNAIVNCAHSNYFDRMQDFFSWLMHERNESVICVVGHSVWLQSALRAYIPNKIDLRAKRQKISNCGILEFYIRFVELDTGRKVFHIDPQRVSLLAGTYIQ